MVCVVLYVSSVSRMRFSSVVQIVYVVMKGMQFPSFVYLLECGTIYCSRVVVASSKDLSPAVSSG